MSVILRSGDIFCTENPMALGKLIRLGESLPWRDGHASEYSHAGIITDSCGNTIEELWTLRANDLSTYVGEKVIIGRWKDMSPYSFNKGIAVACEDLYQPYPFWRMALMLIPNAAKVISTGKWAVCSERVMQFLFAAGWGGTDKIKEWQDNDPQSVADLIRSPGFDLIFEGVWGTGNAEAAN